ncbi:MAG TPA: hypothetical protein VGM59_13490 [Dongiaceae bacterium]
MFARFAAGLIVLAALSAPAFAGCDQAQAIDKMTKLSTALGQKAGDATTAEDSQKIVAANEKVNQGGEALAKGDYDAACTIYDSVAKDWGIQL